MSPPALTVGWVFNLETVPASTSAGKVIAIAVAFSVLALAAIALRFAVRLRIVGKLSLDDQAAAFGALLGVGYSAVAIYQTKWGLGLDDETFPKQNGVGFSRIQYIGGPIYCLAILGFKISLLASYQRVAGFNRTYRMVLYTVMALVTANQIIYTFLLSFGCSPIRKQWDPLVPGKCIDTVASYYGLAGSSLGFDILIIVLPFPILRRLQLDNKKKLGIGILYGIGFFISIIQIVRMLTIAKLKTYTDSEPIILWSIIEINLGVLIGCVPTYAPLFRNIGQSITKVYGSKDSKSSRSRDTPYDRSSRVSSRPSPNAPHGSKGNTFTSAVRVDPSTEGDEEVELWSGPGSYGGIRMKHEITTTHSIIEPSEDGSQLHDVSGHFSA